MEEIIKQFFDWTKRKIFHHLNEVSEKQVFYREKEIWWAALGQNIGYEINGKHEFYERPVLIMKKYNADTKIQLELIQELTYFNLMLQCKDGVIRYKIKTFINL